MFLVACVPSIRPLLHESKLVLFVKKYLGIFEKKGVAQQKKKDCVIKTRIDLSLALWIKKT